jgi:hypothetical protein
MKVRNGLYASLPALLSAALVSIGGTPPPSPAVEKGKPSVSVKASQTNGFAPMRTVITAELKGGSDDYEQFYCPTIEWDITVTYAPQAFDQDQRLSEPYPVEKSEQKLDCEPYEAGKSEIRRRFIREQTFKTAGEYNIRFNLKQKGKIVGGGRTSIRVRGGPIDR